MTTVGVYLGVPPESGGAFQYAHGLLRALLLLPPDRYRVRAVATQPAWTAPLERLGIDHVTSVYSRRHTVYDRVLRNLFVTPSAWRRVGGRSALWHAMTEAACDVWWYPAQETLSYQMAVPAIVTVFDLMHRYESQFPEVAAAGRAARRDRHYRWMAEWARTIVVDSNVGARQFVESYGVDRRRIQVLPPGVPPHIEAAANGSDVPPLPYALPAKFLFYPAQFWAHKNHTRLLDALVRCHHDTPEMQLVLAGSPKNAYAEVRRRVDALGLHDAVTFLGFVPDEHMPALYRRARALVMPTFFGPTNIPPVEAMALGCPVACSNIYAMPEQVGTAALLFDPLSTEDLAAAMRRLWQDDELCAELAARGLIEVQRSNTTVRGAAARTIVDAAMQTAS